MCEYHSNIEEGMDPAMARTVKDTLLSIIPYIETKYFAEEQVKVYGKAVCLYGAYAQDISGEEKIEYYKKALELHRRQAARKGICDIFRGLRMCDIEDYVRCVLLNNTI